MATVPQSPGQTARALTLRPVTAGGNPDPLAFEGPSLTPLRASQSIDEPRVRPQSIGRAPQLPVRDEIARERGRQMITAPPTSVASISTPGPVLTTPKRRKQQYNVNIDYDNGFTYVDVEDSSAVANISPNSPRQSQDVSRAEMAVELAGRARKDSHGSGKPKGLTFYDARNYMHSGSERPRSWQGPPDAKASAATAAAAAAAASAASVGAAAARDASQPQAGDFVRRSFEEEDDDVFRSGAPPPPPSPPSKDSGFLPGGGGRQRRRKPREPSVGWAVFLNSSAKNHMVAALGELIGTTMFLFFAFAATQVAVLNSPDAKQSLANEGLRGFGSTKLLYISFAFGFSLMVNVWIFFRVSGGLFNPAVTLALLLTGAIGKPRALCLFIAQLVGSIAASGLILGLFPTSISVQTAPRENLSLARAVFIEAFLTAELVFTILMLAKEKHRATFIAPLGIGLALFIAELAGVHWTGGSLNPARSFGPNVVLADFAASHWVYWVGPVLGSLLAVLVYKLLKALEYEIANPGQDADSGARDPYLHVRQRQRLVTETMLRKLGIDPHGAVYGLGLSDGPGGHEGETYVWSKRPVSSVTHGLGGNAEAVGPLGTPIRQSYDDQQEAWRAGGRI